eukprot:TRINITY_DN31536_c0_g1_i1.p1 TRINITY_DN31536_c0_g1~~TRINITY_DN31536_c0_g1_i1.p1  ORF type:complete len:502 (-),score=142.53 TRINITY_DN31536_c0_g1_i1:44-1516(-)
MAAARGVAAGAAAASAAACPLRGAAAGRLRWAVSVSDWEPKGDQHGEEFQFLLHLIREPGEREQVLKFVRFVDQKRALLSRLLCRRACAAVLGLDSFETLEIKRTMGRKPFLAAPRPALEKPELANFNFNVSHEGDWVVLASEPLCVCGVDVAAPPERRPNARQLDVFSDFRDQLAPFEWTEVRRKATEETAAAGGTLPPGSVPGYESFQRYWSAKESFVKARGDGLGFEPLSRAAFRFEASGTSASSSEATVEVDGKLAPQWRFFQHRLGANHWVTVARGPTGDVVDQNGEFSRSLLRPTSGFSSEEWQRELRRESPALDEVPVGFLVPSTAAARYAQVGGAPWSPAPAAAAPVEPTGSVNLDAASALKEKGNGHFRAGAYQEALDAYAEAIGAAEPGALAAQLHSNAAACHLQLGAPAEALEAAGRAVELDESNAKAHFRRGRAFEELGRLAEALSSLERAQALVAQNGDANDSDLERRVSDLRKRVA